jgi:hypothetical protein
VYYGQDCDDVLFQGWKTFNFCPLLDENLNSPKYCSDIKRDKDLNTPTLRELTVLCSIPYDWDVLILHILCWKLKCDSSAKHIGEVMDIQDVS